MLVPTILVLLVITVIVEAFALLAVMRMVGTVLKHVRPPRPGTHFGGPKPGTVVEVPGVAEGRQAVVVFVAPDCPSCKSIESALAPVAQHYDLELVAVLVGGSERQRADYIERARVPVRLDLDHLYDAWELPGTPFAVGIDSSYRVVESGAVNSLDQLEALAEHVMNPLPLMEGDGVPRDEMEELITASKGDMNGI